MYKAGLSVNILQPDYYDNQNHELISPEFEDDSVISDSQLKESIVFAGKASNIGFLVGFSIVVSGHADRSAGSKVDSPRKRLISLAGNWNLLFDQLQCVE